MVKTLHKKCFSHGVFQPEVADDVLVSRDGQVAANANGGEKVEEAGVFRGDETLHEEGHLLTRNTIDNLSIVQNQFGKHDDCTASERALKITTKYAIQSNLSVTERIRSRSRSDLALQLIVEEGEVLGEVQLILATLPQQIDLENCIDSGCNRST